MGGIHSQWVAGAVVRDDVGGWGRGGVTLETSAGGEGRAGREGVEWEAPRDDGLGLLGLGVARAKASWAWAQFRRDGEGP
jgi:hypothetical protein